MNFRVIAFNDLGKKYTFVLKGTDADEVWAKAQRLSQGNWHIEAVEKA